MGSKSCSAVIAALSVLASLGCATSGPYTWVGDYQEPSPPPVSGYVIQPGDMLQIRVFNQPDMSTKARVREDGKVSVPFLDDVQAAGVTPPVLARQLQTRFKEFINAPVVTVSLEELRPVSIPVVGEVAKPGVYPLGTSAGVLQALAAAGGFSQYASRDRIFVLRESPQRVRIRFEYSQMTQAGAKAATFRLRPGDTVVVE